MRTIRDDKTLSSLVERLNRLGPDTPPRWGTLTAGEMLCHLGDAHESLLGTGDSPGPGASGRSRPLFKWLALYAPLAWPKGVKTLPEVNPRIDGTRPGDFERDRERAIASLKRLAAAGPGGLTTQHFLFGKMSARDWHRWAYRHVTHHLRQFGL